MTTLSQTQILANLLTGSQVVTGTLINYLVAKKVVDGEELLEVFRMSLQRITDQAEIDGADESSTTLALRQVIDLLENAKTSFGTDEVAE